MQQADRAARGGHLDGNRQCAVAGGKFVSLGAGQALKPGAPILDPVVFIAALVAADVVVVIATH
ncbi:hypothetical protein D3C76_1631820 [compost metagenome]